MNLGDVVLSEMRQSQKGYYCMIPLMGVKNSQDHTENTPGDRGGKWGVSV
jgi:hypothetical protein